jgi:Cu/Ag efflux protein CusF
VATVAATVTKIDLKTRKVTLRGDDGKSRTIKVPEEVRNLPQVKVGDQVVVGYYESIAYQVKKKGEGTVGVVVAEDATRAKEGEKPGAAGAQAVTVTAKIDEIDKKNGTVTLQGPEGDVAVVKVRDPSNLDRVAVGDLIDITYTEAVAVTVEPKN